MSGYQILVSTLESPAGRSATLKGVFTPEEAFAKLTAGTGLAVRFTGVKAVILTSETVHSPPRSSSAPSLIPSAAQGGYDAALQHEVLDALCRDPATRPGGYRAVLDLWIAPAGRIDRALLLGTTGDRERDLRVVAAMRQVTLASPPPGLSQPTTLLIVPGISVADDGCAMMAKADP